MNRLFRDQASLEKKADPSSVLASVDSSGLGSGEDEDMLDEEEDDDDMEDPIVEGASLLEENPSSMTVVSKESDTNRLVIARVSMITLSIVTALVNQLLYIFFMFYKQ